MNTAVSIAAIILILVGAGRFRRGVRSAGVADEAIRSRGRRRAAVLLKPWWPFATGLVLLAVTVLVGLTDPKNRGAVAVLGLLGAAFLGLSLWLMRVRRRFDL